MALKKCNLFEEKNKTKAYGLCPRYHHHNMHITLNDLLVQPRGPQTSFLVLRPNRLFSHLSRAFSPSNLKLHNDRYFESFKVNGVFKFQDLLLSLIHQLKPLAQRYGFNCKVLALFMEVTFCKIFMHLGIIFFRVCKVLALFMKVTFCKICVYPDIIFLGLNIYFWVQILKLRLFVSLVNSIIYQTMSIIET